MVSGVKINGTVLCKFASAVLGGDTPRFLKSVEHWLEHKGVEWVVERLKAVSNAAYALKAGDTEQASRTLGSSGIRQRKDMPGVPSGILGQVVIAYVNAKRPAAVKRAAALLRCYSALRLKTTSRNQYRKAERAIRGESSALPEMTAWTQDALYSAVQPKYGRILTKSGTEIDREVEYNFSAWKLSGISSYYSGNYSLPKRLKGDMRRYGSSRVSDYGKPYASAALSCLTVGQVPSLAVAILGDLRLRQAAEEFQLTENLSGYGKITFLQEGGAKARVVCTPSFWVQVYFQPLHQILMEEIRGIEENSDHFGISCVLDQNRGATVLNRWLKEARTIYSYDLSSATDRFPRGPQVEYLRLLGLPEWGLAVEELSLGNFLLPGKTEEYWSYEVGQPMGVYGSFPLFHLTHYSLLDALCAALQLPKDGDHFAVLGDDVIIGTGKLAEAYEETIAGLGVDMSLPKTFVSSIFGQFAGFTGLVSDGHAMVFRPFKHGLDFSLKGKEVNLLDAVGKYSKTFDSKGSKWWARQYELYLLTKSWRNADLSPLLPRDGLYEARDNVVGSKWFGSMLNYLSSDYLPSRTVKPVDFADYWIDERSILFGEQDDRFHSARDFKSRPRTFNPDDYSKQAFMAKYSNQNQVLRDPLMRIAATGVNVREYLVGSTTHMDSPEIDEPPLISR